MKVSIKRRPAGEHRVGCLICGKPLVYGTEAAARKCEICGGTFHSEAVCEAGHYICDGCHGAGVPETTRLLLESRERDPVALFLKIAAIKSVHMHGPEHHSIVAGVLLTAYKNNGGNIDLGSALREAAKRGGQVPGGTCGYWGVCGAAAGAGIYASIVMRSGPLNGEVWHLPQMLTARCLKSIAKVGGPRCCKRTVRLAIEAAAAFTAEHLGVIMPLSAPKCTFHALNKECLRVKCPYYGGADN